LFPLCHLVSVALTLIKPFSACVIDLNVGRINPRTSGVPVRGSHLAAVMIHVDWTASTRNVHTGSEIKHCGTKHLLAEHHIMISQVALSGVILGQQLVQMTKISLISEVTYNDSIMFP
jgi:hypothetical protein